MLVLCALIQMRDPVPGVFSAEVMLRNMGVPLPWTLSDQVQDNDSRFKVRTVCLQTTTSAGSSETWSPLTQVLVSSYSKSYFASALVSLDTDECIA